MAYFGLGLGALLGLLVAWKRKGTRLDMLHYAAIFAIIGGILATFLNVMILRMM
ncbi:MAG: hypothetical protein ACWA40_01410 [Planktomarina sp.]